MPGSAVSDLAGRVLAGRYLLHAPIGTGASGRVYVADDTRLRRKVAVKVLHSALADDAAFLRRFRAEAQLAASLHHPHIVTVHDWGEDDVPFMVLELLAGGSLRGMLDDGTTLTVQQAARIGRDVASALEYAHARGVLHRDIKPANLLFDEHGIVRVADFGLARALAEASWTEPAGAVFGTARYASPEQARGVQLDGRSDLYSLALVLVEAVTGNVPFSSDTALGTLAARTQQALVAPDALGPLGAVVEGVGAIDPADRYPDAATMRQAIEDVANALPPPAPLPLAGMSDRVDPNPTRAVPTRTTALFDQDTADILVEPAPAVAVSPAEQRSRPSTPRRLVPLVVALVLLLTVGGAAAAIARVHTGSPLATPGFEGLTLDQARELAGKEHFTVSVSRRAAPDPANIVFDQAPKAGVFTTGRTIRLFVSTGETIAVPDIADKRWADVKKQLSAAGLTYRETSKASETVPAGTVMSYEPSGPVAPYTEINVTVSTGHAPVAVPDVTNHPYAQALHELQAAHFTVHRAADAFSSTVPAGSVVSTSPGPGGPPAPYGSEVTVVVSKGPDLVTVGNYAFMTLDDATTAVAQDGLQLAITGTYRAGALVTGQSIPPGKKVARDTVIYLTFTRRGG